MQDPREIAEQRLRYQAKEVLRGRMRSVRRVLSKDACDERSAKLCARVLELPEVIAAKTVVGFAAFGKEPRLALALRALDERGVITGLPRVEESGELLTLHRYRDGEPLEESGYGIVEPLQSAPRIAAADIDVIVVPGLCFDASGFRVGYGKGFYDRLLPTLPRALRVGICYDHELLGELPSTSNDAPVHLVVTDARVLRISG
jgi:5-formyltetrahydrofolate cyclo-ligase